jgi:beta-glucosidase
MFPKDFQWGVASSAFQIEGAWNEDGKGESIWDRFNHTSGKIANGDHGDIACDHYHRYKEDIALLKELNVNSYRFSISWPRILPDGKGAVNQKGLDFYKRLIDLLLANDIKPFITLYHWDLPQKLEDEGGWLNRKMADYFADYAEIIFKEFNNKVPLWVTFNEPWVSAFLGYFHGDHAPGMKNFGKALQAAHVLMLAHGKAVKRFRNSGISGEIGIALNVTHNYPLDPSSEADIAAAKLSDGTMNRWFMDPILKRSYPADVVELYDKRGIDVSCLDKNDMESIGAPIDFMAFNYYFSDFICAEPGWGFKNMNRQLDIERTAMGWPVYPKGLYDHLIRTKNDYSIKSIYISENGAAYDDIVGKDGIVHDQNRIDYLKGHAEAMDTAIEAGVPLKGYYLWSVMDNFEWAHGYTKRFGIVHVNYDNQKRTIKDSGHWYRKVIQSNGSDLT